MAVSMTLMLLWISAPCSFVVGVNVPEKLSVSIFRAEVTKLVSGHFHSVPCLIGLLPKHSLL
jgi:hypothetical protein